MPEPFAGIKDKDLADFCRELVRRGYEVRHMGTDHFQAFWEGEYTHCRIPLTPRSGNALTRAKADIRRFERSHGMHVMFGEQVKSDRPKKPKARMPRMGKFIMPAPGDLSDRRPASIAPSQYTVATMLGAEAMMKLAAAVSQPEREMIQEVTQKNRRTWTVEEKAAIVARYRNAVKTGHGAALLRELGLHDSHITSFERQLGSPQVAQVAPAVQGRREWSEEEMAAVVFRYRRATQAYRTWRANGQKPEDKPQTGVDLLKELGVGNGHITWFTKKLVQTGRYPELQTPEQDKAYSIPFETVPAVIEVIPAAEIYPAQVIMSEPSFDPDEEITELTRQWSELVTRKRELAGLPEKLTAQIDDLLTQAEELSVQRDNLTAEAADVAAAITKVRKRLAEVAGNE